jgi:putative redox protein
MKVVIESFGKVASRVRVGGHELVFDQPATVPGGEDRGPSPLDVMSASVAACAHYFAAAYLFGLGLSPEGLTVEASAEKERVPVSRIGRLELKVHVPAGLDQRHVAGIERAIKSCPAYGTLLHPPSVTLSIERPAEAGTEATPADGRAKLVG